MRKILNNKTLRIILAVAVIISMFIAPSLLSTLINLIGIKKDTINSLLSLFIYLCLIILIFLPELKKEFAQFKNNFKSCIDNGFKYWLIGLAIMIVSNLVINLLIFKGNISANEEINRQSMLSNPIYYTILSAVVLGPILEELIFRKSLDKIFKNNIFYIITSGIIFGFVHVIADLSNVLNLLYIIPYGALGAMFALMNIKTKTVFTSVMMHTLHNLFTCTLILLVM